MCPDGIIVHHILILKRHLILHPALSFLKLNNDLLIIRLQHTYRFREIRHHIKRHRRQLLQPFMPYCKLSVIPYKKKHPCNKAEQHRIKNRSKGQMIQSKSHKKYNRKKSLFQEQTFLLSQPLHKIDFFFHHSCPFSSEKIT